MVGVVERGGLDLGDPMPRRLEQWNATGGDKILLPPSSIGHGFKNVGLFCLGKSGRYFRALRGVRAAPGARALPMSSIQLEVSSTSRSHALRPAAGVQGSSGIRHAGGAMMHQASQAISEKPAR